MIEYMKSIFQLIRWSNLLFIVAIMLLMEKMVAVPVLNKALFGVQLPWYVFCMLILAVVLIAAGGYAVNDYFDVRIDAINRPEKQVVTKAITKQTAMLCHQIMTGVGVVFGLVAAVICRSWSLGLIFVFMPGLLWFYSSTYKRQFIIGNVIVAFASALTPLIIAIANVDMLHHRFSDIMHYSTLSHDLYAWIGAFAFFAFLTTLIREIIKDLQDQQGDRELECHTLPIRLGERWTKVIVIVLILLTMVLICLGAYCYLPFPLGWTTLAGRYILFGLLIPLACELYLLASSKIASDYRSAQLLMKFIMGLGVLFSMVIYVQL